MNVALGAFMLTLLFLPAVSFRLAINRLENLKGLLFTLSITDSIWVFTIKSSFYDTDTGEALSINGDYLIIPMKEVLNINISYPYFDIADETTDPHS